jgi:CubicO group peptidase (beta-lactamase class C family)
MKSLLFILTLCIVNNILIAQNEPFPSEKFQKILDKTVNNKSIFGTQVTVHSPHHSWSGSSGNLEKESLYFIASTTKLYVSAVILNYRSQGLLSLEDTLGKFIPQHLIHGLHNFKGKEHSHCITIRHLLAHTSGLPDYFLGKLPSGKSLYDELTERKDQAWNLEKAIALSKTMQPLFAPGTPGKANYSDVNFQLLGAIIEKISEKALDAVFNEIIYEPLGLSNTYIYADTNDHRPKNMYYKENVLPIPLAMTSFKGDGGIVSNSEECMLFLRAFFQGKFFPTSYLNEMYVFNPIMFPLENGIGLMRFKLPRIFSPFKAIPVCYGHSGLSGAFAYYCPEKEAFITGTVNQINHPQLSYQLLIKLLLSL